MNDIRGAGSSVGEALMNCLRQLVDEGGDFPAEAKDGCFRINGLVRTEYLAERGIRGNPFRVGVGFGGDWSRIESEWQGRSLTPERLGDLFLEDVVRQDIDGNDPETWGFPGSDYTVIFER